MPQKINLAIIGIGNAASALIQGIEYYREGMNNGGLLRPTLAGYHISDIQIVAAVDVSEKKVGRKVSEAIRENELDILVDLIENYDTQVVMGDILDGDMTVRESIHSSTNFFNILPNKNIEYDEIFLKNDDFYIHVIYHLCISNALKTFLSWEALILMKNILEGAHMTFSKENLSADSLMMKSFRVDPKLSRNHILLKP